MNTTLDTRVTVLEKENDMQNKRIDKLEDQYELMQDMNTNIRLMIQSQASINENITCLKDDVGNLKCDIGNVKSDVEDLKIAPLIEQNRDIKKLKWLIASTVVSTFVGGAIGYVISLIF
mgnify:CR=1 FL=1